MIDFLMLYIISVTFLFGKILKEIHASAQIAIATCNLTGFCETNN